MLIKKSETKSWILTAVLGITLLIALTFSFKLYHESVYVKGEYDIVCPQNYGDPISLERCYWPYKFEGESLAVALKAELIALLIIPLIILITSAL